MKKDAEQKYKGLTIKQLEDRGYKLQSSAHEARRDLIELLSYIQVHKRWRENSMHKESSFWAYLLDVFNVRQNTFRHERTAFINYPKEAEKYGIGLITRIQRDCEITKVPTVLKEIKAKEIELKTPIKREQIDKIIKKHTPPKKQSQSFPVSYWEARALKAEKECIEQGKRIAELEKQLERNKPFVEAYMAIQTSMKGLPRIAV